MLVLVCFAGLDCYATLLPLVYNVASYNLQDMGERLGLLANFTQVFASWLIGFSNAKKGEVLTAMAIAVRVLLLYILVLEILMLLRFGLWRRWNRRVNGTNLGRLFQICKTFSEHMMPKSKCITLEMVSTPALELLAMESFYDSNRVKFLIKRRPQVYISWLAREEFTEEFVEDLELWGRVAYLISLTSLTLARLTRTSVWNLAFGYHAYFSEKPNLNLTKKFILRLAHL